MLRLNKPRFIVYLFLISKIKNTYKIKLQKLSFIYENFSYAGNNLRFVRIVALYKEITLEGEEILIIQGDIIGARLSIVYTISTTRPVYLRNHSRLLENFSGQSSVAVT